MLKAIAIVACMSVLGQCRAAENWPGWRGPQGNGVSNQTPLPTTWNASQGVRWQVPVPGEGLSSPVCWEDRVWFTSSTIGGATRSLHCLDRAAGKRLWQRDLEDDFPEIASAITGHAAATPATDGKHVVAMFGNAGAACWDVEGKLLWQRKLGRFVTELGLASSPVIDGDLVYLLCDHDGDNFRSFDSYLVALDLKTGEPRWRAERRDQLRSWSTPLAIRRDDGGRELIVNSQGSLRSYDPLNGKSLWQAGGTTEWVTPSPVFAHGMIFTTSGKNGVTFAVRPGGRDDVTESHVVWQDKTAASYVPSPLAYRDVLHVLNEAGVLSCYEAKSGKLHYRERLAGHFMASPIAGDDKLYICNDAGTTYVVAAGSSFQLLAENRLPDPLLASPAVAGDLLLLRTSKTLYAIETKPNSPPR